MAYYKSDETGSIGEFSYDPGEGWTELTEEELDAFLFAQAKLAKFETLESAKNDFYDAGYPYSGNTYPLSSEAAQDILLKQNLLSYMSNNVSAMGSTNAYILPAGHGIKMISGGQIITVSGFTNGVNNGNKTVYSLEGDFIVVDENLADEVVGDDIVISSYSRYKYHDTDDVQHDFINDAGWNGFSNAIMVERDRIMWYDCTKRKEIDDAADMEALDAITINFSA